MISTPRGSATNTTDVFEIDVQLDRHHIQEVDVSELTADERDEADRVTPRPHVVNIRPDKSRLARPKSRSGLHV